jgi:signal transduction histidine kinase
MIVGAVIWISIALFISGLCLSAIFRSVVASQFDHDLEDHARELAGLVETDQESGLFVAQELSDPRFIPARSGLYWQIQLQNGAMVRSPSLQDTLVLPSVPETDGTQPGSVDGPTGPMRLLRKIVQPRQMKEPIEIRVGVDERLISDEMKQLNLALVASLGTIAFGMVGTAYAQVAYGLRPLVRIRQAVVAVRSGDVTQLPDDLPDEVMPLVTELNGMIAANLHMVERARVLAGNFAHAFKMPLAVLTLEARELEQLGHAKTARVLLEQCLRMTLLIDYQTARARASALKNAGTSAILADILQIVISAYSRLNVDNSRRFEVEGPTDIIVACDPNDLTEMIGNLIDNAAKWARERVGISIADLGSTAQISVEDDGPGIPEEHREAVFGIGVRLDEQKPGTGLGLAITRELAALYDGRLWIERSRYGGAAVTLALNKVQGLS